MNRQKNSAFNKLGLIVAIITENTPKDVTPGQEGFPKRQDQDEQEQEEPTGRPSENLSQELEQPDASALDSENPEAINNDQENPYRTSQPNTDKTTPEIDDEENSRFSNLQERENEEIDIEEHGKLIDNNRDHKGYESDLK